MSEDDEFDWSPNATWFVKDEYSDAAEHCAEMVLKAMRAKSKEAGAGYLAAAQWFALAAKTTRMGEGTQP